MAAVKLLTVNDVSKRLKISAQSVRLLIKNGQLSANRVGNQWLIPPLELSKYISQNHVEINPDDHPRRTDNIPDIVALSFFSGAMGLDIGMQKGGIHPLLACEINKACRMTIEKNVPEIALIGDINKHTSKEILEYAKIPDNRKVDVMSSLQT